MINIISKNIVRRNANLDNNIKDDDIKKVQFSDETPLETHAVSTDEIQVKSDENDSTLKASESGASLKVGGENENKTALNVEDKLNDVKPESEYERLSRLYNQKQEKPRANVKVLMVFSIIATIAVAVVGAWCAIFLLLKVLGVDGGRFFGQTENVLSFGIAGLTGFIFYVSSFALIVLICGVTALIMKMFIKLCKNLNQTKYQPYHIVAYNGTYICMTIIVGIELILFGFALAVIINTSESFNWIAWLFVVLTVAIFAVFVDLIVELCIARVKYSKYPDKQLKLDIKKEALERYKYFMFRGGRDVKRAKTRRRWF